MFFSTRTNKGVNPSYAIIKGLADDGGLYVSKEFNKDFFKESCINKTYQEIAFLVMREFLDDFSNEEIHEIIQKSYNNNNFYPDIVTMKHFDNHSYLNLFNGNTSSFKDMALSVLPNLFSEAKKIQNFNKKTVILTATSGDTGSATLSGFSQLEDVYVIVLYPANGVSEFQKLQMNYFKNDKHFVIPINGNFDDCQRIVKDVFNNYQANNLILSSANSINIGRIIPQIIYYVYSYCKLVKDGRIAYGDKIDITVPTGNFGNIYSAYIAKSLGVPIRNLVIASNKNNVLTRLFNDYKYDTNKSLHKTISPSMDILVSSNFERYLYNLTNKSTLNVMNSLKDNGFVEIKDIMNQKDFYAFFADESDTKKTIKKVYESNNYLIDPHTAVGKYCADKYKEEVDDLTYMLIVSTASPFKFCDALLEVFDLDQNMTLKEKFIKVSKSFNYEIDKRMYNYLDVSQDNYSIPKEEAYDKVIEIVGDIDAKS